ncbi:divergent polysaccharide deacetylase family protein [Sneathiella sp.]|jgi:polysaccharide deacetylase 2 family uncharacterized protein YibQ|uniref:divergent polysaccharide deacetylase family protein n=1 Tax=Sneathiella sp. TaxID=1964365 RepID=UPI0039E6D4B0
MSKNSDPKEPIEEKGPIESLVDSPLRLLVFCAALLIFSLAGGMLIGSIVKENRSSSARNSVPVMSVEKGTPETVDDAPLESEETIRPLSKPVDALSHDNPYTVPRDESLPGVAENLEKETVIAALPPSGAQQIEEGPAWQRYAARSGVSDHTKPTIAIVIDDVGLNRKRIKELVALDEVITLSFLPYAPNLQESVQLTRSQGHEAMLHLPMEPTRASANPGPNALLNKLSAQEIRDRVILNLDSFEGYVGVNNHMGSKFTAYEPGMQIVMDELAKRDLLFLDSKTTSASTGYRLALEKNVPAAIRDVFIDNVINVPDILKQLKKVEKLAAKNGHAIAIGHPHAETISALKIWMPQAVNAGYNFSTVSHILSFKNKIATKTE